MKKNKIISLLCSTALLVSMFASLTVAQADTITKPTFTATHTGYTTAGTSTFAVVDFAIEFPDTFAPYTAIEPDWETSFENTYTGSVLQGIQIDIPVDTSKLIFTTRGTADTGEVAPASFNSGESKLQFLLASSGTWDSMYSGSSKIELGTVEFMLKAGADETYTLDVSEAIAGIKNWDGSTNANPVTKEYLISNFDIADPVVTIKPAVVAPVVTSIEVTNEGNQYKATVKDADGVAMTDETVTWTVSAGSITDEGLFTAPEATTEEQTVTITATSTTDTAITGTATVIIDALPAFVDATASITGANGLIPNSIYYTVDIDANDEEIVAPSIGITDGSKDKTITLGNVAINGTLDFYIAIGGVTSGTTYTATLNSALESIDGAHGSVTAK